MNPPKFIIVLIDLEKKAGFHKIKIRQEGG